MAKKVTFKKAVKKFRKADIGLIYVHVLAKFLFGVGLGMLLVPYLNIINPVKTGWIIIVISLVLTIPMIREVYYK